jgi:hypothetical protein
MIKYFFLSLVFLSLCSSGLFAKHPPKPKVYVLIASGINHRIKRGFFYSITDTSLILSHKKSLAVAGNQFDTLKVDNIKKFKIRPANSLGNGILIGLLVDGLLVAISETSAEDGLDRFLFIVSGVLISPLFIVIGAIIGSSINSKFYINGNRELFKSLNEYLKQFTIQSQFSLQWKLNN